MDAVEIMDSIQEMMDILDRLGDEHPRDAETQRLVRKGIMAGAAGMKKANLLLLYRDSGEDKPTDGQP